MSTRPPEHGLVWYVSFGSNMSSARFACYVSGGTPSGGAHTYPGCRDKTLPRTTRPVWLAGGVYFALRSQVWGGGMALYDPELPESAPGAGLSDHYRSVF